jgi:hypothetical protein
VTITGAGTTTITASQSGNDDYYPATNIPQELIVNQLPTAIISGTVSICSEQNSLLSIELTGIQPWSITYTDGTTPVTLTDISESPKTISISPEITTTYTLSTVTDATTCENTGTGTAIVTVSSLPAEAGSTTGTSIVCQDESVVTYSVSAINEATSYIWSYSGTGATINGSSENITIDFSPLATSGDLTVKGTNICGDGATSESYSITVNPLPDAAGTITGSSSVCYGETSVSYFVPSIANATSYTWAYSGTGGTITGNGNSITIDFAANATGGNLTVKGINDCGEGAVSADHSIVVNSIPEDAGTITGPATICEGETNVSYSIPEIAKATSYIWSYSGTGATINGTSKDISINFDESATNGALNVKGSNICGDGALSDLHSINVIPMVGDAGIISGDIVVCPESEKISYSIAAIANATEYVWTLPEGASGNSNTNQILLDFGSEAASDFLTVKGLNACSESSESQLEISVIEGVKPKILLKWDDILICYNIGDSLQAFQWYKDGEEIPNASEQFYQTHQEPGSYFITTVDTYGCTNVSSSINIETVSKYTLFPNPTNSTTRIQVIDSQSGNLTISLLNSTGIVIKSFNHMKSDITFEEQIDLSDILPGIYTVEYRIDGFFRRYSKLIIL